MSLEPGARLGQYEILALIGAGGMGEVFRARDTTLDRDVAIKVLPDAFVADPDRVARFRREAKTLAALNHPNIATIHGFEESSGAAALVLELVDGPTLAERLSVVGSGFSGTDAGSPRAEGPPEGGPHVQKGLPLDEALPIARQIALALEAAHEQGIVHRDLKPANVKIRPNGAVKVLDFGLAKLQSGESDARSMPSGLTHSPTLTSPLATLAGTLLGTAAYMAPEQARGKPVDKRVDIWAFGCVLYEMLTGRRAFGGDEVSDTLAFIITKEVDWSALPASTPPAIRRVLRRCLEKDPSKRLHDIADARIDLDETAASAGHDDHTPPGAVVSAPRASRSRQVALFLATALVSGAVVGLAVWAASRQASGPRPQPVRVGLAIAAGPGQSFGASPTDRNIAISPDGTRIAYIGTTGTLLMRSLDQLDTVSLSTDVGRSPFFSPDGKWIGFFSTTGELKKVSVAGGPPISICRVTGGARGASWGTAETIVFAIGGPRNGLYSVAAAGGEPKVLTRPDETRRELSHYYPFVLPGGRAVLYTALNTPSGSGSGNSDWEIAVVDVTTGQQKLLVRGASQPEYVASGHLVYASGGALRAVRFDPQRLVVVGDPVPVVDRVLTGTFGSADYDVSQSGTLVYVPSTGRELAQRVLTWVDRQGKEEPINAPARAYAMPRVSPDGTRVALDVRDQESDIWVFDFARRTLERRTFDPTLDQYPVWTPDGRRILFASPRAGLPSLYAIAADGTGSVEAMLRGPNPQFPTSISPDGTRVILREPTGVNRFDLTVLTLGGKGETELLLQTPFNENNGEISPDGHWLAYQSDESGRDEIYVRPFPNVNGGRWQVSTSGGTRPLWARSGRELFFLDAANLLHAVAVTIAPSFKADNPVKISSTPFFVAAGISGRNYDVSPDGKRFLMIKELRDGNTRQTSTDPTIVMVLNWFEELKTRLPNPSFVFPIVVAAGLQAGRGTG